MLISPAYAADHTPAGDMMKNCNAHMKDGKMMDAMPMEMREQCQDMMKSSDMKNSAPADKAAHHAM